MGPSALSRFLIGAVLAISAIAPFGAAIAATDSLVQRDIDLDIEAKPKQNGTGFRHKKFSSNNRTLQKLYKQKNSAVRAAMEKLALIKKSVEKAKGEALEAKHKMQAEQTRLTQVEAERRAKEKAEYEAEQESIRQEKREVLQRAQVYFNLTGEGEHYQEVAASVSIGALVDVLLALPRAVKNERFSGTVSKAVTDLQSNVDEFVNTTYKKLAAFETIANAASDAELAYMMAKFFHENVFRLKSLHKETLFQVMKIKRVMPVSLRMSLAPIMMNLASNTAVLRINATELAQGSLGDACHQVADIMGNISDYDSKLTTVHTWMDNATRLLLPRVKLVMPAVSENVSNFIDSFLSIARMETVGLQQAAHALLEKVGPIVEERVHCTWSSAPSRSISLFSALIAAAVSFVLL